MSTSPDGIYLGRITARSDPGPAVDITYSFSGFRADNPTDTITVPSIMPTNRPWPPSCPVNARPIGEHATLSVQSNADPKYQLHVAVETPDWTECEQ